MAGDETNGERSEQAEQQAVEATPPGQLEKIKKALMMLQMRSNEAGGAVRTNEDALKHNYAFWHTQPVPKLTDQISDDVNECIEADITDYESSVRQDPYSLPDGFVWDSLDIADPLVLTELYVLLNENYVEDTDHLFRFDYSAPFLKWALSPPGCQRQWHCAVRVQKSQKMMAFIAAVPITIRIRTKVVKMVEINFLCVHKKLRSKRLAPVLIREITRRANLGGIFQAVYTAGVVLPTPVATCRYWHRSLNPRKLVEIKFSQLSRHMTLQRHIKLNRLPETVATVGLRPIRSTDFSQTCRLLNEFLAKFHLTCVFSEAEFVHWFTPQPDVVESFVVVTDDGQVTDFISFYSLPSTVMESKQHKQLRAAYSFYNVATSVTWTQLMTDALVLAKQLNYDVFNALDLMENASFLSDLKFGIGDGDLRFYLYNWRCASIAAKQVGLVLQ